VTQVYTGASEQPTRGTSWIIRYPLISYKYHTVIFSQTSNCNVYVDLTMLDIIDTDLVRNRGHPLRIVKSRCRINARLYSFVPRNINIWNSLTERLVKCGTVQTFRRHLDRTDFSKFIESTFTACICCCILFFLFFFCGGRYQCLFKTSTP